MKTGIKRVLTQMVLVGGAALIGLFLIESPASAFSGSGPGTVADPYQITNATQLQEMKDNLVAHYVLMNDIDCSDTVNWNGGLGFEPVGYYDGSLHVFTGTFDGQGYVITGLYINRPSTYYVGLFGGVDHGTVKNVGLEDIDMTGPRVGGLISYTHYVTISNCHTTGNVTATSDYAGGLVDGLFHSTVRDSYSTANVSGASYIGGLVGYFWDGQIIDCYSTGNVNGTSDYVGGLIGGNGCSHSAYIYDSYSTGDVNGTSYVGGVMGHSNSYITISNSYSTGSVTGSDNIGGLVGKNDGTITNCYYNNHAGNPSVGIGSGSGDCTAIGNNESYFYYSSNPPMSGWDFVDVWAIYEGVIYPYLLWQIPPPIIYVDADATGGANNGTSWSDAYLYLQDALAVAVFGDYIFVAQGTYKSDANTANPDGSGDRTATFQLINGVGLYGGYAGYGATDLNERNTELYQTILSGDLDGNDVQVSDPCDLLTEPTRAENSYHVVTSSGTDLDAVLDGFTITAGNANGTDTNGEGGGMRNYLSGPTVVNCTFSGNSAADGGGGMDNDSGDAIVINCTFSRNSAMADGGGMCNDNFVSQEGSPTVTNCTFNENWAVLGGGMSNYDDSRTVVSNCVFSNNSAKERGGAMSNDISSPTVTDCTFSDNSAGKRGGGMDSNSSSPTVTNCTFSNNNSAEWGGGMWNFSTSNPTVTNCVFIGNSGSAGAAGMHNHTNSSPIVTNCTFSNNSGLNGGGMFNAFNSNPTIINCTFSGNSAVNSGAMCNGENSSPTIKNCTFSGNSASDFAGCMYNYFSSNPTLLNCILWGNSAPSDAEIRNVSSTPTVTYSDVAGGYGGTGNIDEDPVFIGSNGLDGIPGTADDEDGNVHLRAYSPCINAGDPTGDYTGQVDVDNQPRVAYGRVDMGVDEVFPIAGDFESDGDVDLADFAVFANHWLLGAE